MEPPRPAAIRPWSPGEAGEAIAPVRGQPAAHRPQGYPALPREPRERHALLQGRAQSPEPVC